MNSEEKPNPRQDLEDLIEQQGGNSLENCNLEFLGYQHGLKGEMPRQDLAHHPAYRDFDNFFRSKRGESLTRRRIYLDEVNSPETQIY